MLWHAFVNELAAGGAAVPAAAIRGRNLVVRVTPFSIDAISCWLTLAVAASSDCDSFLAFRAAMKACGSSMPAGYQFIGEARNNLTSNMTTIIVNGLM